MRQFRPPRWVFFAAAAAVILAVAIAATPFLIPVDDYRPLLISAIDGATGHTVEIDKLQLKIFPNIRVNMTNFRLRNPAGFPAGDALAAQSVDLGVNLRALLSRRLDVLWIKPQGVSVTVLRDQHGRTNFAFAPHASKNETSTAALTVERIPAIGVAGAHVSFADVPVGKAPSFSLENVGATIGSIDPQAKNWIQKLDVSVELRGAHLVSSLLAGPVAFRAGTFAFRGNSGRGTFDASLRDLDASGTIAFATLDPLSIAFALSTPDLNLNSVPDLMHSGPNTSPSRSRALLAQGTLAAAKVEFLTFRAQNFRGRLSLYNDGLQLQNATLAAYGGTLDGDASVQDAQKTVPFVATVRGHGLSVAQLVEAVAGRAEGVSGTLTSSMRFATTLAQNAEKNLTGSGTFAVTNGGLPSEQLRHFNYLGGDLRLSHERGYSNALTLTAPGMHANFHGSFGFDTTLSYAGTGIVSGPSQIADAQLRTVVAGLLQQKVGTTLVAVPFTLHGTFSNPQFQVAGTPQLVQKQTQQPSSSSSTIQSLLKSLKL